MDTNIRKDVSKLYDLLETLSNLHMTYEIDKLLVHPKKGAYSVIYIEGQYKCVE